MLLRDYFENIVYSINNPLIPTSDVGFSKSARFTGVITAEDISVWGKQVLKTLKKKNNHVRALLRVRDCEQLSKAGDLVQLTWIRAVRGAYEVLPWS
jgi:hypothetical protein